MIAKFGFVLVLIVFGALMFTGGVLAPDSLRQSVAATAKQVTNQVKLPFSRSGLAETTASSATSPAKEGKTAPAQSPAGGNTAPAAAADTNSQPVPIESLLIPTPMPEKGRYAVQAGLFTDNEQADALARRIQEMKHPFDKVLEVVDQAGRQWSLVPVGPYASAEEARTAAAMVAQDLRVNQTLPLIFLPSEKPES